MHLPLKRYIGGWRRLAGGLLLVLLPVTAAHASLPNRLLRLDIRAGSGYTRLSFKLSRAGEHSPPKSYGRRLVIGFRETDGPLYKKFRSHVGPHVAGIHFSRRRGELLATLNLTGDNYGVRVTSWAAAEIVVLDVGPALQERLPAGRERLWQGAERLIRQYDPPLNAEIPFVPTQRKELPAGLSEGEKTLFLKGEASLYKGRGGEAESIFQQFAEQAGPLQGVAAFRLGEARYLLQNYRGALDAFRRGERLQSDLSRLHPGANFCYADSLMRTGDYRGGRSRLQQVIAQLADQPYAPLLLVRLADTMTRHGYLMDAQTIYQAVVDRYPAHKAAWLAALKIADHRFFTVGPLSYEPLTSEYRRLGSAPHPWVREESLFRGALLTSLFAPVEEGLEDVVRYEKRYGRGAYGGVVREMREELVHLLFQKRWAAKDCAGLTRMVGENRAYLARSLADGTFLPNLSSCFLALGQIPDEIALFIYLSEREWGALERPYLLSRIAEDALALGDLPLAERSCREFLDKYPGNSRTAQVRECLAAVSFQKRDFPEVITQLGWLLTAKGEAGMTESYYYLGKAYEARGMPAAAERAATAFLAHLHRQGRNSPYRSDAHLLLVNARHRKGDLKGALAACRAGLDGAGGDGGEPFAYKLGELLREAGQVEEARGLWQKLAQAGKDPVWRKLAAQQLADMEWWARVGSGLRRSK